MWATEDYSVVFVVFHLHCSHRHSLFCVTIQLSNRPVSQIPLCIRQICYKKVHCVIWDWCIVGFVQQVYGWAGLIWYWHSCPGIPGLSTKTVNKGIHLTIELDISVWTHHRSVLTQWFTHHIKTYVHANCVCVFILEMTSHIRNLHVLN